MSEQLVLQLLACKLAVVQLLAQFGLGTLLNVKVLREHFVVGENRGDEQIGKVQCRLLAAYNC